RWYIESITLLFGSGLCANYFGIRYNGIDNQFDKGVDNMPETYQPTWDLDALFPGGSDSQAFQEYLQHVEKEMDQLSQMVDSFQPEQVKDSMESFAKLIEKLESTRKQLRDGGAFVSCLSAQDVHDKQATQLVGKMGMISAKMGSIQTNFD